MKTGSCGAMQCLHTNYLMTAKTASNIRMKLHHRLVQLPLQLHVLHILIFVSNQGANTVCTLQQCTRMNCSSHMINSRMMIKKIHIIDIEENLEFKF
jgi:hypothetical protein